MRDFKHSLLFAYLVCITGVYGHQRPNCEYRSGERELVCEEIIDPSLAQNIAESTERIVFTSDSLACDCSLRALLEWREELSLSRRITLEGVCSSPKYPLGQSIISLSSTDISCGADDALLVRKRRAAGEGQQPNKNKTYTPDAPLWPCDFEEGFCQWFQLHNSDFQWTRHKGHTLSTNTGPTTDHTKGTVHGYYIYIETSLPRRQDHKARLVSPTLAPVDLNSTCQMDLFIHMKGNHIGALNIYQQPVVGFAVNKLSLTTNQGSNWFKRRVQFHSDTEFQVIIEGVRGAQYQGDIALDDISFTAGCKRLASSYVRLVNGSTFNEGRVEVYHQDQWQPVCSEGWSQSDTSVACRELGFKNGSSEDTSLIGMFTGLSNVTCKGDEATIKDCSRGESSKNATCPSNSTVTVKCAGILPVCPLKTHFHCPADGRGNIACISRDQLCDFTNDCWDGFDEINCENYTRCDFNDTKICGWLQAKNDQMDWTRHKGNTPSIYTGPSSDHNSNPNGYYLYMEVSNRQGGEKARMLVIPRFQGDNNGLCKLRFYYHLHGRGIGTLRVLAADRYSQRTLWTKSYSQINDWGRAEVPLFNLSSSFHVTFEGEHSGYSPHGDITIDDISFTPECRPAPHENVTCKEGTFPCRSGECISLSKQCDFTDDCYDASDELNCGLQTPGRCDFEADMCHWQNLTDDDFDWERHTGSTASFDTGPYYDHTKGYRGAGYYLYIEASNPRVRGHKARIISPQFMWQNVAGCTLRFYYHMKGLWGFSTLGTLRVILRNTITGAETSPLWHKSGNQGNRWLRADVDITTNWTVSQVIIEAERGSTFHGDIAIDDISFSPQCYPSEAVHIYKNYDVRLTDGKKGSFEGRVEIYRVGTWGTICDDGWGLKDAGVVCKQLGYGGVKSVHAGSYFGEGRGPIWLDDLACYGNETSLGQCAHNGWGSHDCAHSQDAGVICDIDGGSTTQALRLKTSNRTNSGPVEIYHSGSWEPICYDGWDIHDAFVACRQLGFPGAESITRETLTSVTRSLKKVQCQGGEDTLGDCVHNGWSGGNCNYGFAGVICSVEGTAEGNIRLRGGSSEREGRVEVFHRGEWGTVCDDAWTEANSRVVCYELGFTSVRKVLQSFGPGSGRVWLDRVSCHGNETALVKCGNSGWGASSCRHSEDVGVICSDDAYIGCYKDTQNHVMTHELTSSDMTPVKCIRRCQSKGFMYAGLEWANECYCGSHFNRYGNSTSCQLPCLGDASKVCGGTWALSVYNTDPAIVPTQVPGYNPVTQSCTTRIFLWQYRIPTKFYAGDHSKGWISSPAFPNNYFHSTVCIWVLNLHSGTRAKVTFKYFQTEQHYDYVEIRDGDKDYSEPTLTPPGGFTGNVTKSVTATGNVMWIKFYTDSSVNDKGFNLTYEAVVTPTAVPTTSSVTTTIPPSQLPLYQMVEGGCNGISHSLNTTFGYLDKYHSSGFIQSPNHPLNYDNNLLCRWFIRVAPGYRIHLEVSKEDVNHEAHVGGLGDKLTVEDEESSKSSRDSPAPWSFLSKGSLVRLVFVTDSANTGKGFYLSYTRVNVSVESLTTHIPPMTSQMASTVPLTETELPTPRQRNTAEERKGASEDTMSGGTIAGIVIPILLVIIGVLILLILIKTKRKRLNQGVRHGFVNDAYGDCESINMNPTQRSGEAAQPVTASQNQPSALALPAQEPTAYFTAAPPPYSQAAPGSVYFVPFAAAPGGGMAPVGVDNTGYAQLCSAPPAYEAIRQAANSTTATGIGSVTSLREAAKDGRAPVLNGTAAPGAVYAPLSRSVLPPIRGTQPTDDPVKKQAPQEEEAGPLPEKSPLTVEHAPEPTAPPRPLSATSQVRVVSPAPPPVATVEFDTEVPFEFLCPITNKIMSDPVKASDGYNYERKAIRRWFRRKRSSPMTNETLTDFEVRPNDELRSQIERFVGNHSVV